MMMTTVVKACGESTSGMPSVRMAKTQVMRPSGRKIMFTTVSVFMMSFWRVSRSDLFVSRSSVVTAR